MEPEETATENGNGNVAEDTGDKQLGRVALKRVAVTRGQAENGRTPAGEVRRVRRQRQNPMNALVPYLDLFDRLGDGEMSRLAEVSDAVVAELRAQVQQVKHSLAEYVDLLPRLSDEELARVSGAEEKTIRFWRLCRPKSAEAKQAVGAAEAQQRPGLPATAAQSGSAPIEGVTGRVFPGYETDQDSAEVDESDLDLEIDSWVDDDELELEEL